MKQIKQEYSINVSVDKVWDALTNPKTISEWGGGPAKMSDKEGFGFSFWGGQIYGKNIKVQKERMLVQEWFGGNWDKPSIVTFTLTPKGETTMVLLEHINLPEKEVKNFADGWKNYYMGPIKNLLEGKLK